MNCSLPPEVEAIRQWVPILPLYGIDDDGKCACGRMACTSPGKHPMQHNGAKDATQNKDVLLGFMSGNRFLNWGMTLPGLWVLDVDPRNGGDQALKRLEKDVPELSLTLIQYTGGGGLHIFFKLPDAPIRGKLGEGLDIKSGPTSYVVIAPSRHVSGGVYQWAM